VSQAPALRAVLFDAAGTLIELREPVGATYSRYARRFGADVPAARLSEAFGRVMRARAPLAFPGTSRDEALVRERSGWREIVDDTFRSADGAALPTPFDACFAALWDHYAGPEAWQLTPGAREALTALRAAGLETGVVSNFDQRLQKILESLEINDLLGVVVTPADVGAAKPDPRIFEAALARLGLTGPEVAYVGDRADHDVVGARGAGLQPIALSSLATLADLPRVLGYATGDTTAPR
jgi:putative hydrolase of the HAD superfamily